MFNKSIEDAESMSTVRMDPGVLMKQMKEEGLSMKKNVSTEQKQNKRVLNMYGKVKIPHTMIQIFIIFKIMAIKLTRAKK